MLPKFSVIIPVYNGADFIEKTVLSVLAQEYPAHEIIVIDDGSTDETPKLLRQFEGKIITRRIENGGVAGARNAGMKLATGDYFAFLDSDDVWFRNRLKKLAEVIEKYPNVGFLCSNYAVRYVYHKNRLVRQYSILRYPEQLNFDTPLKTDPFKALFREHFVGTASAGVVKREVAEKVGLFDTYFRSSQDYEYWLRCAVQTDFLILSEVLFYKKTHPGNISTNFLRTLSFHRDALQKQLRTQQAYIQSHGLQHVCRQALAEIYYMVGDLQYETRQYGKAFANFFRGWNAHRSPRNTCLFLGVLARKSARFVTFGLLSREHLSITEIFQ